jgi:asparagine synthetase B (glutamine-hydrolysing)
MEDIIIYNFTNNNYCNEVRNFFEKDKNLVCDYKEKINQFTVEKYSNHDANNETSKFKRGNITLLTIGTLIYNNKIGKSALFELHKHLNKNEINKVLENADGHYLLVIVDDVENKINIVTDHAGVIQVYSYDKNKNFIISTSSLSISRCLSVSPNYQGIAQFLRLGNVYGSSTIYKEIDKLEPATNYELTNRNNFGFTNKIVYWKTPNEIFNKVSFADARAHLSETLKSSYDPFQDEKFIMDFTGGFDSRLNLAIMSKIIPLSEINTFVFGPRDSKEANLVKKNCDLLGINNVHLQISDDFFREFTENLRLALIVTDGEENAFSYIPILYAQIFKTREFDYSINGLGGEIYRDFWWRQELHIAKKKANLSRLIKYRILQYEHDDTIYGNEFSKYIDKISDNLKEIFTKSIDDMDVNNTYNTLQLDNLYYRQKIRCWAGKTINSSNQIIKTISPLTFKKCVSTCLSIYPRHKKNGRLVKAIIDSSSKQLSALQMLNGAPAQNFQLRNFYKFTPLLIDISKTILRKFSQRLFNKTIFSPASTYYKPSLWFSLFFQSISSSSFKYEHLITGELFDQVNYNRFLDEALSNQFSFSQQLGNILSLELRMRRDNLVI